jgi:very-short-patch-repair endonuclease
MRAAPTPAEEALWNALRDGQLGGLRFRRQHPVSQFVVDFCCSRRRLIIEIDGKVHLEQ